MHKTILYGAVIMTDDDARDVRLYVENRLTRDECATIFGWARAKGVSHFQDDERHHYAVTYSDSVYTITEIS